MSYDDAIARIFECTTESLHRNINDINKEIAELRRIQKIESVYAKILGCFLFLMFGWMISDIFHTGMDKENNLEEILAEISRIKTQSYAAKNDAPDSEVKLVIPSYYPRENNDLSVKERDKKEEASIISNIVEKNEKVSSELEEDKIRDNESFLPSPRAPRQVVTDLRESGSGNSRGKIERSSEPDPGSLSKKAANATASPESLSDEELLNYNDNIISIDDELLHLSE